MAEIQTEIEKLGYKPFPCPLGLKLDESDRLHSPCIRCDSCDGYPCLIHAKSDSDINCIRKIMDLPNVTLLTEHYVTRLVTNATGTAVTGVETESNGTEHTFQAISLPSAVAPSIPPPCYCAARTISIPTVSRTVPTRLAATSCSIRPTPFSPSPGKESRTYMKTFSMNDFYFGEPDYPFPMGNIQPIGSFHREMMERMPQPSLPTLCCRRSRPAQFPGG